MIIAISIWPSKNQLGTNARHYNFNVGNGDKALFRSSMYMLPEGIGESIGTSTLFAAWNAVIYVSQIEDERLEPVVSSGGYLNATAKILHEQNRLWFNDETFTVSRKHR